MDTPDKNRISAVSLCNFEESPLFKYINDLSPIEAVKSGLADNILNPLAFASPSALFTSPHVNSNRESRFSIKRHRSPLDLLNPAFLLDGTVTNSRDVLQAVKTSEVCPKQLTSDSAQQLDKISETKPLKAQFSLVSELAKALKKGSDRCDIQMVSCVEISAGVENGKGSMESMIKSDEDILRQPNVPNNLGADLQTLFQTEKGEIKNGSGVMNSISHVAGILSRDQRNPNIANPVAKSFALVPKLFPPVENGDAGGSCGVQVAAGAPDTILSSSSVATGKASNATIKVKEEKNLQPSRKQRSARRRCLTFDVGGTCKKKPLRDSTNDHPSESTSIHKFPHPEKQSVLIEKENDDIHPMQKTGLHLNGLVNTCTQEKKLKCKVGRALSLGPTTFNHELDDRMPTPVSTERVLVSCDNKIVEEAPEKFTDTECFDKDTLTRERQRLGGFVENASCKRCRCRRSKCLKLYCECFAAGLYCIEPCSCQDCFNKPIHEELVVNTRQRIEARNPLAFAPKVVASFDSASDFGDESSKTPASVRHKWGCNCKRSSCLKKYCECFQMGVGCSLSCRCVGCKNTFGHKNAEQFHVPCSLNSHHHVDHSDVAAWKREAEEGKSEIIRSNQIQLPSSIPPFPSLTSPRGS